MKSRNILIVALLVFALTPLAAARDIVVPDEVSSLRTALKTAERGDRILLRPGNYVAHDLDIPSGVILEGNLAAPRDVVIDGQGLGRIFLVENASDVELRGLTLTGGVATEAEAYGGNGGALLAMDSSVALQGVVFETNRAEGSGGAVRGCYSQLTITDCTFTDNRATGGGGGLDFSYESSAAVEQSTFRGNSAAWGGAVASRANSACHFMHSTFTGNTAVLPYELGGAFFADYAANVLFMNCVLTGNAARRGGAVRLTGAQSTFANCTLDGNAAWESGAAFMTRNGDLNLNRTIVSFNQGESLTSDTTELIVNACDIYGNSGGDWTGPLAELLDQNQNFSLDPLYCDVRNLHLQLESPCAPENSDRGLVGALPAGCNEVGIVLQEFDASVENASVILTWTVSGGEGYEFRLTGRSHSDPDFPAWTVPYEQDGPDSSYRALDKPPRDIGSIEYLLETSIDGGEWFVLGEKLIEMVTDIPSSDLLISSVFPNPFNPRVNIKLSLTRALPVRAEIYDVQGRRVRTLVAATLAPGEHDLSWDSRDDRGRPQSTGTYLLRIIGGNTHITEKLLLVK